MNSSDSFGRRLREERERRQIALESIVANTNIGIGLLRGLERDDVSRWPTGIFRRAFIRGYAEAIGLDPEVVVQEFLEHFPDPIDATPQVTAVTPPSRRSRQGLRLTLADTTDESTLTHAVSRLARQALVSAVDLSVVFTTAGVAWVVMDRFWMPLAVAAIGYYAGSVLCLGRTPASSLQSSGRWSVAMYDWISRLPRTAASVDLDSNAETTADRAPVAT